MGRPETAPPDPRGFLRQGAGVGGGNYSRMPPVNEEGRKPKCLLGEDCKRAPVPPRGNSVVNLCFFNVLCIMHY